MKTFTLLFLILTQSAFGIPVPSHMKCDPGPQGSTFSDYSIGGGLGGDIQDKCIYSVPNAPSWRKAPRCKSLKHKVQVGTGIDQCISLTTSNTGTVRK